MQEKLEKSFLPCLLAIFPSYKSYIVCRPPPLPPKDPSSVKCQKSCSLGLSKTCLPLYIGNSGICLSLIGLTAYAILQIPSIRSNFNLGKVWSI